MVGAVECPSMSYVVTVLQLKSGTYNFCRGDGLWPTSARGVRSSVVGTRHAPARGNAPTCAAEYGQRD